MIWEVGDEIRWLPASVEPFDNNKGANYIKIIICYFNTACLNVHIFCSIC